jgi:hypothetical protein
MTMTLRAADKKDERGWQLLDEEGNVVAHESSRDKARAAAKNGALPGGTQTVLPPAAKDTRTPEQIAADAAQEVDSRIKATLAIQKSLWLQLASDLYLFKQGRMWDSLGYASFSAYIADADADLEPRYAYKLVEAYEQLVIERGVEPERLGRLHVTKVQTVLPAIRRRQVTPEEALSDVEVLGRRDLETKYSGKASPTPGRPDTSSKIHTDHEPTYMRCPVCSSRVEMDPETGQPKQRDVT